MSRLNGKWLNKFRYNNQSELIVTGSGLSLPPLVLSNGVATHGTPNQFECDVADPSNLVPFDSINFYVSEHSVGPTFALLEGGVSSTTTHYVNPNDWIEGTTYSIYATKVKGSLESVPSNIQTVTF